MTPDEMRQLADEIERGVGGRVQDAYIRSVLVGDMTFCDFDTGCYHGECESPGCGAPLGIHDERKSYPRWYEDERLPRYTTNLKDAVDAVPEGWRTASTFETVDGTWQWSLLHKIKPWPSIGQAHNPAAALCAAILRAKAAEKESENG